MRGFETGQQMVAGSSDQRNIGPTQVGNPSRPVVRYSRHELIEGVAVIMAEEFKIRTWMLTQTPLMIAWPKVRVREGVEVIKRSEEEYLAQAMTSVPMMGTVRQISSRLVQTHLTLAQVGIGAGFHGDVLDSPSGPEFINKMMDTFAESANITMSINTAIRMVNAAWQQGISDRSVNDYQDSFSQRAHQELRTYACIGTLPGQAITTIEKALSKNPSFNMVFLPDGARKYLDGTQGPSVPVNVELFRYDANTFIPVQTDQTLQSLGSLSNGNTLLFEMTKFNIYSAGIDFQALETEVQTGSVVLNRMPERFMHGSNKRYTSNVEDVYVYSHPADHWRKIKFQDGIRHAFVWDTENMSEGGYHPYLLQYLDHVNQTGLKPRELEMAQLPMPYPIATANKTDLIKAEQPFYLPQYIGNLSPEHLDADLIDEMTNTALSSISHNVQSSRIFEATPAAMGDIDQFRVAIEGLDYDAKSIEEIVRVNLKARGVVKQNVGRNNATTFGYRGHITPESRVLPGSNEERLVEMVPNVHGGLDITDTALPVGFMSAGGMRTLANTPGHPLSQVASRAYDSAVRLVTRFSDIFEPVGCPILSPERINPNLHHDDPVQCLLDAVYGQRLPAFVAVPQSLIDANANFTAPRPTSRIITAANTGKPIPGTGNPEDGYLEDLANGQTAVTLPGGATVKIRALQAVDPQSTLFQDILAAATQSFLLQRDAQTLVQATDVNLDTVITTFVKRALSKDTKADMEEEIQMFFAVISAPAEDLEGRAAEYRKKRSKTTKAALKNKYDAKFDGLVEELRGKIIEILQVNAFHGFTEQDPTVIQARTIADAYAAIRSRLIADAVQIPFEVTLVVDRDNNFFWIYSRDDQRDVKAVDEDLNGRLKNLAEQGLEFSFTFNPLQPSSSATVADVASASYFRSPLNFTLNILRGILDYEYPWMLPADPRNALNRPIQVKELHQNNDLVDTLMAHPYLTLSQSVVTRNTLNRGGYDVFFQRQLIAYGQQRAEALLQQDGSGLGAIHANLKYARMSNVNNMPRRLLALAILLTPHFHVDSIGELVKQNVMPPFAVWYWRLWSTYLMGDAIVMESGIGAGGNFYNHERVLFARDGNSDRANFRATMDAESTAVDKSKHALVGPMQPRQYVGGHDHRLVKSVDQLANDSGQALRDRPSLIATLNPRYQAESREYPMSFLNKVPGRFDIGQQPSPSNPRSQYWSGSPFYSHIFEPYFADNIDTFQAAYDIQGQSYHDNSKRRNHLAYASYGVFFDSAVQLFKNEQPGNGHRPVELNCPGAQAYMEGGMLRVKKRIDTATLS